MLIKDVLSEQEFYVETASRQIPTKVKALSYPVCTGDGNWTLPVKDVQTQEVFTLNYQTGKEEYGPKILPLLTE